MKLGRVGLFALLGMMSAVGPAMADGAQQFDLICHGNTTSTAFFQSKPVFSEVPATKHLRIDLTTGQWCQDDCREVAHITDVTASQIVLTIAVGGQPLRTIDRRTGSYMEMVDTGGWGGDPFGGSCTPAPFTPFPTTKF